MGCVLLGWGLLIQVCIQYGMASRRPGAAFPRLDPLFTAHCTVHELLHLSGGEAHLLGAFGQHELRDLAFCAVGHCSYSLRYAADRSVKNLYDLLCGFLRLCPSSLRLGAACSSPLLRYHVFKQLQATLRAAPQFLPVVHQGESIFSQGGHKITDGFLLSSAPSVFKQALDLDPCDTTLR